MIKSILHFLCAPNFPLLEWPCASAVSAYSLSMLVVMTLFCSLSGPPHCVFSEKKCTSPPLEKIVTVVTTVSAHQCSLFFAARAGVCSQSSGQSVSSQQRQTEFLSTCTCLVSRDPTFPLEECAASWSPLRVSTPLWVQRSSGENTRTA